MCATSAGGVWSACATPTATCCRVLCAVCVKWPPAHCLFLFAGDAGYAYDIQSIINEMFGQQAVQEAFHKELHTEPIVLSLHPGQEHRGRCVWTKFQPEEVHMLNSARVLPLDVEGAGLRPPVEQRLLSCLGDKAGEAHFPLLPR